MRRFFSFLLGALIGGFIGAVLSILLAPSSGKTLRSQIVDHANKVCDEVKQAAVQRRSELEQELERMRQPIILE
jgi:gas vesicle protein